MSLKSKAAKRVAAVVMALVMALSATFVTATPVNAATSSQVKLLAALIYCEAGGESYEGQLAVGAVVVNRINSSSYPDTLKGVIYQSGQFGPASSGKLASRLSSGNISSSCYKAARQALKGVSNIGTLLHFQGTSSGKSGIIIGNHVFY